MGIKLKKYNKYFLKVLNNTYFGPKEVNNLEMKYILEKI